MMMTPAGSEHGRVAINIGAALRDFVKQHSLGVVWGAETGFLIEQDPDTVRAPDVAFVRRNRMPDPMPTEGFFPGTPDLAVEVLSPSDRASEVFDKVEQWLDSGAIAVWVLDPVRKTVAVYNRTSPVTTLGLSDTLSDETLLPAFNLPVAEIFAF